MSTTSEKKTETSQKVDPWGPQANALTGAFDAAKGALSTASGAVAPTNFTAQMTPEALAAFRQMVQQGGNLAIPNSQAATGAALTGAGTDGVTGALTGLAGYNPATGNSTDAQIAAANKYVAGRDIDAEVNNAMLNARQTARDVTMPGIEMNAAGTGNTNSSRTGIANGLVERGLTEQAADLGGSLRSKAFDTGLSLAQTTASDNNAKTLAALQARGALGTSAASTGLDAGNSSIANQGALSSEAVAGGAGLTAAQQAILDNQAQQYASKTGAPFDAIKQYMAIVGSNNWGSNSTGTSTETKTPSAWDTISGLMSAGGSAAGGVAKMAAISDRRYKTNITRIGTLDNGLPLYSFEYVGDPQKRMNVGLMAQDVELVKPEAVEEYGGVKVVNYTLACA